MIVFILLVKIIFILNRNLYDIYMYIYIKLRLEFEFDVGYDFGFFEYFVYLVFYSML